MEMIIAILIALGTLTVDDAKLLTSNDMAKVEQMAADQKITSDVIKKYEAEGIIDMEDTDF